jgi:hypothetical protein
VDDPPTELDGARVLAFAVVSAAVEPTGNAVHRIGDAIAPPAAGIAIARYEGDHAIYLFYCDPSWRVVADTLHPTEELAREQAEFEYHGVSGRWVTRGQGS